LEFEGSHANSHDDEMMATLVDWLSLKAVPGVGNRLFLNLLQHFGDPDKVLSASREELLQVEGVSGRLATNIETHRTPEEVEKDLTQARERGVRIITFSDVDYPQLLRHIHDPPPVLYVQGCVASDTPNIAIVGSRHATPYGREVTERLSADLARCGLTIVSGMAIGIDTAAHTGTISAGGRTIAVLGCGLDTIYPAENRKLFHRIAETGAVITEFSFATPPEAHNFPRRNRVISGLSLGTVIVEATQRSGSLITARLAAEQGREVFAVPGSVASFKSMGTHHLIKQGAKLVEHAQDVMEELNIAPQMSFAEVKDERPVDLTTDEKTILCELSPYPVHIDRLIRRLPLPPAQVSGLLLQLELKGLVTQSPGKFFATCDP
jgi:DNA processing protein